MARGLAAGLATGLNTGYNIARQAQQDELAEKQRAEDQVYKARADERADAASKRENERLELSRQVERRQQERLDEQERRQRMTDAATLLEKSNADILARSRARTGAGMPVDPGDEEEYGQNRAALRRIRRQGALNFFSRVSAGTASIDDVSPGDFYMNFTAATDMEPEELAKMPKYIDDIQAGLQTGNQGLVVEATNGLMTPQLRRGVGAPSPYGGVIVKKEIIGLDPARDANGQDHPNRFIPRLRVYVNHPSMQGPRMENGATGYYDTVMTKGGTTEETDLPVAIDIGKAMDWMGNLGVLANAVQNPQVAARLEQGKREKGADAKRYRDDLIAMSRPTKKNTTVDKVDLGDRQLLITRDETGKEVSREEIKKGAVPRILAPHGGAGGATEPTINDDTLTAMAEQYLAGDKSVFQNLGRGAQGAANVVALRQRVAEVAKEVGMTPDQIALAQAEFMGQGAAQRSLGTRTANFGLAEKEALEMAGLVRDTSAVVSRTTFMPINKAIIAYNDQTGDPETRAFGAALNSFINAYARAVSPVGTPTVSDKDHARAMLSRADSHKALLAIMDQLEREMKAAEKAPAAVRDQLRRQFNEGSARIRDRGQGAKTPTFASEAEAEAAAKAGKLKPGDRITINGQTGTWQ
ncbi:MAG: hypothetical protein AB7F22_05355 [Reyranella sp.]|uniref:hypothetical protein n=1 Tax=Reyranella sp. TaxID=1929291 RepID=UPI003D1216B6